MINHHLGAGAILDLSKAPHFDPLVSRIERSAEEKGLSFDLEHISYVAEVEDADEYSDDEGNLNTTQRTDRDMSWHDKNGDAAINFNEYLPQFIEADIDENEKGYREAGWWMEQFNNADVDTSGNLDFNEFKGFLHPKDSDDEEIQKWLLREKMKLVS
ncbi:hypothetical protein CRYUN_Cryun19dG0093300 [Craigia yunnanensis]